jgi:hypothetical protein
MPYSSYGFGTSVRDPAGKFEGYANFFPPSAITQKKGGLRPGGVLPVVVLPRERGMLLWRGNRLLFPLLLRLRLLLGPFAREEEVSDFRKWLS